MSIIFHGIGNNGSPYIKDLVVSNQKIIITYNDNSTKTVAVYEHPTTSGNKHIPAGGVSGQILRWSADGTAEWGEDNNTTYELATSSLPGLMSSADKAKLDGIAEGANKYTYIHPNSGVAEGTYTSVTVDLQGHIISGANPTTLAGYGITDAALKIHTHNYASSSSVGGSALSAEKLDIDTAGSEIQPVYFNEGKPIPCTYTIAKSVPSDAIFTDHIYSIFKGATSDANGESGLVPFPTTDNIGYFLCSDGTWKLPIDTTYSVGTSNYLGITKLYTETGTATDGTMTQNAITTALNGKSGTGHTHNYAGSSTAGGAANSANKLATARTINGTNFDGSGNITTSSWGTARNITVGNTTKSVNGSGNVSWSMDEIGVHVSTTEPTASDGKNGDIWIVYEE